MRIHLAIFASLFALTSYGQSFFDLYQIQEIKIYFPFTDWDMRMDTAKAGADGYTLCDSVVINGGRFDGAGVKYKGNSSYSSTRSKNPLHIKLDFSQGADYQGYEDIKLGNGWSDNSMIREPLAYEVLRQYMDVPLSNFAKVFINGAYYGLMNNAQDIDKVFLSNSLFSSNRIFFKCNPESIGAGLGNGPSLNYLGSNPSSYTFNYEVKSDTGYTQLIGLCDTLNNQFSSFNLMADIDKFLWMLAFNNCTVNLDSYSGAYRQNYYLYRNHANQWSPIVWDLNMCFGGFSLAGGTTAALTPTAMQTMSYTLHKTESGWPLIFKLLNDPFYAKMYNAHLRTLNNENFVNLSYKSLANNLHSLVDTEVQNDPNYLGTYADFQNSLTSNTNGSNGAGVSPGIYPLMDARAAYLSNVLSAAPAVISNIQEVNSATFGATANINANITNVTNAYLGYRYKKSDRFVRTQMYDDGQHGDGGAGDGVFGAAMPLQSLDVQYYIYAENANTGAFSPERAEHEFHSIQPTIQQASLTDLAINELTANNSTGLENEFGKNKDWIEIYNKTSQPLGLSNLYLSNLTGDLTKWQFPTDAFIGPNEHLLVWADDNDRTYLDHHTNFNLNNLGESLYLSDGTTIADQVTFGSQSTNMAYGRCVDGTGGFTSLSTRTPRAANACQTSVDLIASTVLTIVPNPTTGYAELQGLGIQDMVEVIEMSGKTVLSTSGSSIDLTNHPRGLYLVRVRKGGEVAVGKVVID